MTNTTDKGHDRHVVTYRHAYVTGETSLCRRCRDLLDKEPHSMPDVPVLGSVQYGEHDGHCDLDVV